MILRNLYIQWLCASILGLFSRTEYQGTASLVMKSPTRADNTINTTPTPTLRSLSAEQEEQSRVVTAVIVMLVVIAVIVLLIALMVIGIVILKANTSTSYEFKPSSEKGMCAWIYITSETVKNRI